MRCWIITLCVLGMLGVARADDTVVTGRVTDVMGRPLANARVYVLPRQGTPLQAKTDRDGRYRVTVATLGTHGVVIAIGKAHTFRTVLVQAATENVLDIDLELDSEGGEVIKIEDRKRPEPTVKAKPKVDPRINLPYSEEAVERDAWARAWLLLDVDERGAVTRLKLLKPPGFGLDAICIESALALTFDPARDHAGRPMKTYMLWTFEWPAWGWLVQGNGVPIRRPADTHDLHPLRGNVDVTGIEVVRGVETRIGGPWARAPVAGTIFEGALERVPCAGSGPLNLDLRNRAYRDCSQPDLTVADALPWITKDTAATAIAELANPRLALVETREPASRVPAYIATGVTGALVVGTVLVYRQYSRYQDDLAATPSLFSNTDLYVGKMKRQDRWKTYTLGMTVASVVSVGVTFLLWNRDQPKSSFSVQPSEKGQGASAAYHVTW